MPVQLIDLEDEAIVSKFLLADDDVTMCTNLSAYLRAEQHACDVVHDGAQTLEHLSTYPYDAVILDWDMPELSGLEVCVRHRRAGGVTPILMLTGKDEVSEKELALDSGADDYLTKPFHPRELAARLRAITRRPRTQPATVLKARHVEVDLNKLQVRKDGVDVVLQPVDISVLVFFLRHPGQVVAIEQIIDSVWEAEDSVSADSIYSSLRRIRRQIDREGEPSLIANVYGRGYKLDVS